jgi:hypothetical protein
MGIDVDGDGNILEVGGILRQNTKQKNISI